MIAAIRIRGRVGVRKEIEDTLKLLRLKRINNCVLLHETDSILGMLKKVKDFITWGEIKREVLIKLLKKRLRLKGNRRVKENYLKEKYNLTFEQLADELLNGKKLKEFEDFNPVFRLRPPRKGFKSIKEPWPKGDLGYRGEAINELLERMI